MSSEAPFVLKFFYLNEDESKLRNFELWVIESFFSLAPFQTTFMQYDMDRSGTVEPHELHAALAAFGKSLAACHAH